MPRKISLTGFEESADARTDADTRTHTRARTHTHKHTHTHTHRTNSPLHPPPPEKRRRRKKKGQERTFDIMCCMSDHVIKRLLKKKKKKSGWGWGWGGGGRTNPAALTNFCRNSITVRASTSKNLALGCTLLLLACSTENEPFFFFFNPQLPRKQQ